MLLSKKMRLRIFYYKLLVFIHNFLWNKIPRSWSYAFAGKADFDNLLKVIVAVNTFNTSTVVSQEIDFELPRGYVAKIHMIEMRFDRINEDMEALAIDSATDLGMVLVLDPDDTITTDIGENETQQDAIAWHKIDVVWTGTGDTVHWDESNKILQFTANGLDVITARNARMNSIGGGPDVSDLTEASAVLIIYYTLEKVTDVDILNLLDIL